MIKEFFIFIKRAKHFGLRSALIISFTKKKTKISINGINVTVRGKTPDIRVAIQSIRNEYEFLDSIFPPEFSGLIVDAGGYIGTASMVLSNKFPKSKIVIIEPSSENLELIKENVKKYKNIFIEHGALYSQPDSTIKLTERGTGHWGFTVVNHSKSSDDDCIKEFVRTITLKNIREKYKSNIEFLKLDIEGAEMDLFERDSGSLRAIPVVMVELHDRIVSGCTEKFLETFFDHWIIKLRGEKYAALSRN